MMAIICQDVAVTIYISLRIYTDVYMFRDTTVFTHLSILIYTYIQC